MPASSSRRWRPGRTAARSCGGRWRGGSRRSAARRRAVRGSRRSVPWCAWPSAVPAAHVQGPVRHGRRGLCLPRPRRIRSARRVLLAGLVASGLVLQAAAVPGHCLLGAFCQVVPRVPAIGDLDRARRAVQGSLGVGTGAVPADDLRAGMGLQPFPSVAASRIGSRSTTSPTPRRPPPCRTRAPCAARNHPPRWPAARRSPAVPAAPSPAAAPWRGARRSRGSRPAGRPRPASSSPNPASMPSSGMLRRRYRSLSPPACSAKVTAGHCRHPQRNRRTCKTISTGRARRAVRQHPRVPAVHPRRLLTAPRAARPATRHNAEITTACPMSSTRCTRSPARCGNSTVSRLSPCSETSQARRGALTAPAGGMTD